MKGLSANIYKSTTTSSNGGISSFCDSVVLIGEGLPEIFSAKDNSPLVTVIYRERHNDYIAVPTSFINEGVTGYMFGGSFVYSSDSRFKFGAPIKLFDRLEK